MLGIIGVVAAITIPTLIQNAQDRAFKAAFKKAYAAASQAWLQAYSEDSGTYTSRSGWSGCTWTDGTSDDGNPLDNRHIAFKNKMKVIKSCVAQAGCWPASYEGQGEDSVVTPGGSDPDTYSWISADGMCWSAPAANFGGYSDDSHIAVDTNCDKKPNLIGQDMFSFLIASNGAVYLAIDSRAQTGIPVSKGQTCPFTDDPATINGRTVSFKDWLLNK